MSPAAAAHRLRRTAFPLHRLRRCRPWPWTAPSTVSQKSCISCWPGATVTKAIRLSRPGWSAHARNSDVFPAAGRRRDNRDPLLRCPVQGGHQVMTSDQPPAARSGARPEPAAAGKSVIAPAPQSQSGWQSRGRERSSRSRLPACRTLPRSLALKHRRRARQAGPAERGPGPPPTLENLLGCHRLYWGAIAGQSAGSVTTRIGDPARVGRDILCHALPGGAEQVLGDVADVRGDDDVVQRSEGVIRGERLAVEDVQPSARRGGRSGAPR